MTFNRPNIKYTDMAIYIDNNVYRDDLTEEEKNTIFEYLYHIAYMIACKKHWFRTYRQYDEYAIFTATRVYLRYHRKTQLPKIKSCLNFLKSIAYPAKVDYLQFDYSHGKTVDYNSIEDKDSGYSFTSQLLDTCDSLAICDFRFELSCIDNMCKDFFKRLPIEKNTAEWDNIYISCLLTFLNTIVLDRKEKKYINAMQSHKNFLIDDVYLKKKECPNVILFHLDKSYEDYINVLTRELKHFIAQDLQETLHQEISASSNMMLLLQKELQREESD